MLKYITLSLILLVATMFSFGQVSPDNSAKKYLQIANEWYFNHILLAGPDYFANQLIFLPEVGILTTFETRQSVRENTQPTQVLRKESLTSKLNGMKDKEAVNRLEHFDFYWVNGGNKGLKKNQIFDLSGLGGTW